MAVATQFAIAFASVVAATDTIQCNNTGSLSSRGAHCRHSIEVDADLKLVCVQNAPFSAGNLLTGGLLRLFDVQRIRVRSEQLSWIDGQAASVSLTSEVNASMRRAG